MVTELPSSRVGRWAAGLREHPGRCYWVSVPLLAACLSVLLSTIGRHFLDLEVYRLGVHAWLAGRDLYGVLPRTSMGNVLPFIYPPFAALVMVPLTVSVWGVATAAVVIVSLAALGLTLYLVVRRLWPTGRPAAAAAATTALLGPSLALEPVSQTIGFGQINLVLMAMVTADVLVVRTRWPRGTLIGLAAAIKLTPAAFVLYFLLRREYRAAATVAIAGAVATGVGAVAAPGASLRYFTGRAGASGVSGSPFFTNQTYQAVLTRTGLTGPAFTAAWLVLSVAVLLLAAPAIRRSPAPLALVATAGVALLVSPTSWSHHWVWIAPALLVGGVSAVRSGSRLWAVVTAVSGVLFVLAPFQFLPHDDHGLERTWSAGQQVVGASYVIAATAVYVVLWLTLRRRPTPTSERSSGHRPATTDTVVA